MAITQIRPHQIKFVCPLMSDIADFICIFSKKSKFTHHCNSSHGEYGLYYYLIIFVVMYLNCP